MAHACRTVITPAPTDVPVARKIVIQRRDFMSSLLHDLTTISQIFPRRVSMSRNLLGLTPSRNSKKRNRKAIAWFAMQSVSKLTKCVCNVIGTHDEAQRQRRDDPNRDNPCPAHIIRAESADISNHM